MAEEGKKDEESKQKKTKGKVKLRNERREEEEEWERGRGPESQCSEHSKPCSAKVYLTSSVASVQCKDPQVQCLLIDTLGTDTIYKRR